MLNDPRGALRAMLDDLVTIMTTVEIGGVVGCSHSSVSRMRAGKQGIDYTVGKQIERLHRDRFPEKYAALA
jgi:hypothetical protein